MEWGEKVKKIEIERCWVKALIAKDLRRKLWIRLAMDEITFTDWLGIQIAKYVVEIDKKT